MVIRDVDGKSSLPYKALDDGKNKTMLACFYER